MAAVTPEEINRFWIDETGPAGWFAGGEALDRAIRDRFMAAWERAGDLSAAWKSTPEGMMAALILTDQFPRNMFREDPRAFATDPLARALADEGIAQGFDLLFPNPQRNFFYLPFEHSEDMADQDRAIALMEARSTPEHLHHARLHRDAIRTFGRFPWRNAALNRDPSPEEAALMAAGGYGALVSGKVSLAQG